MSEQDADRAAIIDLIHRNRIAAWTGDFDAYQRCLVHADYTTRWSASHFTGIYVRQGWNDIAARWQRQHAKAPIRSNANAYDTTISDLHLQISGDMAWAVYNQHYVAVLSDVDLNFRGLTREARVFERHDGEWRVAFLGVMDVSVGGRDTALLHLAPDGTVVWQSPAAERALATDDDLTIRNGRLRVRDSHTDEKLQAAIAWAAELDDLLTSTKGAMPILLEAGEGLPTRVWWVIVENGMIAFSMGDATLDQQRIDAAAKAFNLSAAQKEVAALIVAGKTLMEVAEELGITANTARTHLDRIFDKTGVRAQPALVRVLLSTAAPI